ncbi:hypothetical protein G6O69_08090 [Pseudenhygromyxa sp. WMMC2535]|uniref:hypothetical protein n=1 Tax=Pseudenhygromyxa sp. WMMC2535 TaxID=2712867 RepID=UPI0015554C84|nr:hypothetical protein [Pseudenhygromyxa sp. WMMC2535]NVB37790.1 hypothetical protein [Pseudenhygromyxa sp. WMMC2535]
MSEHGQRLDVGSLLTIDVESELRKLTQAQLQGPWQLPAELVRQALRAGALRVEVELGRNQLRVRAEGGEGISPEVLRELAALLDGSRPTERRHRALSTLERLGALALLGLVGLDPSALQILTPASVGNRQPMRLEWRRGQAARLERLEAPGPRDAQIVVRGAKLDRARAKEWLANVARHAPVPILVDGRPLLRASEVGFEGAICVVQYDLELAGSSAPCTFAIPREGDIARIFLLQDGLLSAHMSVPDAPCFEAALETSSLPDLGPGAGAARLREAATPHLEAITAAAVEHIIGMCRDGASLATADRSRLTQILLSCARRSREHARTIARLPLFRGIEPDGRERWCDLLSLRQSVHEDYGERQLTALFPDQNPADFVAERRVYILDESERALLGELLELGFRQPRRRVEGRRSLARSLRELPRALRGLDLAAALRPGGRLVPETELDAGERGLLIQLRAAMEGCEVAFCTGSGPVRRVGSGPDKLLMPRGSAQVQAAILAVTRDPSWVYPALLALLDGSEFPTRARRRWRIDSWRA